MDFKKVDCRYCKSEMSTHRGQHAKSEKKKKKEEKMHICFPTPDFYFFWIVSGLF